MDRVISRDGTPIAVWRTGAGPPLLLVHGTAADHTRWAPVLPALSERFTVLAMDRRGRGGSGDGPFYEVAREVEDVVAVVEWAAASGEPVDVLGHSYGGACALEAALACERIRRLVVYEAPMGFVRARDGLVGELEALLGAGERDELLAVFMHEVAGLPPEQIELLRSLPAWEGRRAAAHTIPREQRVTQEYAFDPDRFRAVRVPTLLLQGGDSSDAFMAAGEALRAALPDARLAVMPGQRHAAMDTGTELFCAEVLGFLADG
jgi:pimeloyl-ACP methyl ester carboxylesterase